MRVSAFLESLAYRTLAPPARFAHRALRPHRLTIVMYHAVAASPLPVEDWCFLDEATFRRQMDYLREHFDVLPLSEAVDRLRAGNVRRPAAVITFDDGFQSVRDVALDILRERGLPATVFLATGLVGTSDTIWYCRLNKALASTRRPWLQYEGGRIDLSTAAARARAGASLQARLKTKPHPRLLAELGGIVADLGDDPGSSIEAGSPYRILGKGAVAEMSASGVVEFGGHTRSHAILSLLAPPQRDDEIDSSLDAVAELTGRPCRLFSYPNGRAQDYDAGAVKRLETRGVRAAVTTRAGPNEPGTPPLELRRYGIGAGMGLPEFRFRVHHAMR